MSWPTKIIPFVKAGAEAKVETPDAALDAFPRFRKQWDWSATAAQVPGFAIPPRKDK